MTGEPEPRALREILMEDFRWHGSNPLSPGFRALAVQRIGVWRRRLGPGLLRKASTALYKLGQRRMQNRYAIEVHESAVIGRRVRIADQGGIVIARQFRVSEETSITKRVLIGDDCWIGPGVTLGRPGHDSRGLPQLGRRVVVGTGAVLVGEIQVGDDAVIGPNAIVLTDVPPGATVRARPTVISEGRLHAESQERVQEGHVGCGTLRMIVEDWVTHGRSFLSPGFHALSAHRLRSRARRSSSVLARVAHAVCRLYSVVVGALHQIELPETATIGRRVRFGGRRKGRIVIAKEACVGDDCVIDEDVTIGWAVPTRGSPSGVTALGRGVQVASGAVLLEGIRVGDRARIGFNAVLESDVPAGATAKAPEAKLLRPFGAEKAQAIRTKREAVSHG